MTLAELATKKRILLLGYGVEGKATEAFLRANLPGVHIDTADKKDGPTYLNRQERYDLVIKTPGIPKRLVRVSYTTATNIFFANVKGQTIGITGSKGKSTTASLIYEIIRRERKSVHLVGNIGTPLLTALMSARGKETIYVCELSSYQLDDFRHSPHIAVMTNFFAEHMDYHGSVNAYWRAKTNIVAFQGAHDFFVYNPAVPKLRTLASRVRSRAIPFIDRLPFPRRDTPLLGAHNYDNVRAAVTVGGIVGVSVSAMQQAVKAFKPLPHRLEKVGAYKGITFYDDAIATTPQATLAALKSLPHIGTIFFGGQDRGYDFRPLVNEVLDRKIPNVVLFPDSGEAVYALFQRSGKPLPRLLKTKLMKEAVQFAFGNTPTGTVCLLSCASPSYSLWKNFEEKGNQFQHFVKLYGKSHNKS